MKQHAILRSKPFCLVLPVQEAFFFLEKRPTLKCVRNSQSGGEAQTLKQRDVISSWGLFFLQQMDVGEDSPDNPKITQRKHVTKMCSAT